MRRSLTKKERLRTRQEITRVFSDGTVVSGKGMRLAVRSNGLSFCRVVVIPARGHQRAVDRNRSKRHGKELFRLLKTEIDNGHDVAIVMYFGDYSFHDRRAQLTTLLQRAHVFSPGAAKEH